MNKLLTHPGELAGAPPCLGVAENCGEVGAANKVGSITGSVLC